MRVTRFDDPRLDPQSRPRRYDASINEAPGAADPRAHARRRMLERNRGLSAPTSAEPPAPDARSPRQRMLERNRDLSVPR